MNESFIRMDIECSPIKIGRGLKSLRNARNFSNLCYSGSDNIKNAVRSSIQKKMTLLPSNNNSEVFYDEDIFSVEYFSLELLHSNESLLQLVQQAIIAENEELHNEISQLSTAIESQSDMTMDYSSNSQDAKDNNSISPPSNVFQPKPSINKSNTSVSSSFVNTITIPLKGVSRKDKSKYISGNSPSIVVESGGYQSEKDLQLQYISTPSDRLSTLSLSQDLEDSPSIQSNNISSIPKSSKFRNRLNSARDDLHFFDEF